MPGESLCRSSDGRFRSPTAHRVAPVDSLEHVAELRSRDRHHTIRRRGPDEPAALEPLGVERHPKAVVPKDLQQIPSAPPEDVKITGMRVTLQRFLNLQRKAIHAATHIGVARGDPYAHARW